MAQPPQRVPGGWSAAAAVAVLGVGLSIVAVLSSVAGPVSNTRGLSLLPRATDQPPAATAHPSSPAGQITRPAPAGTHSLLWLHITVDVVVAAALLVLAGLIWRYRSQIRLPRWARPRVRISAPATLHAAGASATSLAEQARRALVDLTWDDGARAGVIGCWERLERAAAEAGLAGPAGLDAGPSRPASRVSALLAGAQVPSALIGELRRAFERARFSTHPVTDTDLQAARDLLARILQALGPLREALVAGAASTASEVAG